jgi:hypothetical protein
MAINLKTDYSIDQRQIVGEKLPNVFIKKITLETVNSPAFGTEDRVSAHASDPDSNQNPLSDKSLKVSIDLCLKDYYNDGKTMWFGNPMVSDIQQNFGVYLVQVTDRAALDIWSKVRTLNDIMWKKDGKLSPDGQAAMKGTEIIKIGIEEFGQANNPADIFQSQPEKDSNGKSTYNFIKTVSFPSERKPVMDSSKMFLSNQQKTLGYFAFSMITPPPGLSNPQVLATLMGKITSDVVFMGGTIPSESYVFIEKNTQRIWGGEVHYHDGDIEVNGKRYTGFMGGSSHGHSVNQPLLDRVRTSNDTILDFRELELAKKKIINFVETKKDILDMTLKVSPNNNDITTTINNTDAYFSAFYDALDANGNIKFMFGFDMQKYLRDNTLYSKIFSSRQKVVSQALRYVNIKSLRLYRTRPQLALSSKPSLPTTPVFSPAEFTSLAPTTFQDSLGDMQEKQILVGPDFGKPLKKKYSVNQARELIIDARQNGTAFLTSFSSGDGKSSLNLLSNPFVENNQDLTGVYMFSGVDKTFSTLTHGNYRYEIEMEVEVNLESMISEQMTILQSSRDTLKKIIDTVTQKGKNAIKKKKTSLSAVAKDTKGTQKSFSYYDIKSKSFTNKFLEDLAEGTILGEIDANYWANIPVNYASALNILADNPQEASGLAENMKTYLNPISTSVEEYGVVITMIEDLIGTYQEYVDLTRNAKKPKGDKQQNAKESVKSSGKSTPVNNIQVVYKFAENLEATNMKSLGNLFFDLPESQIFNEVDTSLKIIPMQDFGQYVQAEQEKLFAPNQDTITISSYAGADASLSRTAHAYFTPSIAVNTPANIVRLKNPKISEGAVSSMAIDKIRKGHKLGNAPFNRAPTSDEPVSPSVELSSKISDLVASSMNVTIKPVEPMSRPSVSQNTSNTFTEQDRPDMETLTRIFDKTNDTKEQLKAVATLKRVAFTGLQTDPKKQTKKPTLNMFRPEVLSSMDNISNQTISELPNQVKALIVSQDNSETITFGPNTYLNQETTDLLSVPDPFKDATTTVRTQNFFENICTLEVLSGFEMVPYKDQSQRSLKLPIWKTLTSDIRDRAAQNSQYLLCRLSPYSNNDFDLEYRQEGSLPILEKYFILGTTPAKQDSMPLTPAKEIVNLSMTLNNPLYQVSNPLLYTETPTNSSVSTDTPLTQQPSNGSSIRRPPDEDAIRQRSMAQENFSVRTGAPASQSRPLTPRTLPDLTSQGPDGNNNNSSGGGY